MLNRFRADLGLKIFKVFRLLGQPKMHFRNQRDHDTYRYRLLTFICMDYEIYFQLSYCYHGIIWEEPGSCLGAMSEL